MTKHTSQRSRVLLVRVWSEDDQRIRARVLLHSDRASEVTVAEGHDAIHKLVADSLAIVIGHVTDDMSAGELRSDTTDPAGPS